MKNLLKNLLNWVLKKGSSETKKDQVSLRAIRYAAVLFMVLMVGIGQAWGAITAAHTVTPNLGGTQYEIYSLGTLFTNKDVKDAYTTWIEGSLTSNANTSSSDSYKNQTEWFNTNGTYGYGYGQITSKNPTTITFRVTNCTEVAVLSKSGGSSRGVTMSVKENGSNTELGTQCTSQVNSVTPLVYGTALERTKTYNVFISAAHTSGSGGNVTIYQIRFKSPAAFSASLSGTTSNASAIIGESAGTISCAVSNGTAASATSYQWYKTTSNKAAASSISGATSSTYSPNEASDGTYYYYCAVTPANQYTAASVAYTTKAESALSGAFVFSSGSTWKLKGSFDGWGDGYSMTGSGTVSVTRTLTASTKYEFKLTDGTNWYGNGHKFGGTETNTVSTNTENCYLMTSEAGSYKFDYNTSTNALTITYPNSYTFYYANSSWSKVYVYKYTTASDVTGENATWPGVEIASPSYTCGGTNYYAATSDGYATLIFTNNDGSQTGNMAVSSSDAGKYVGGTGNSWSAFPTYTVTYNANGDGAGNATGTTGSVPTDASSPYACGSTVTVLGNTGSLAKDGYNFIGWNTAPGGGGTSYVADATFTISANTTLYAQWELIPTYDVIYNTNGGTGGSTASQTDNHTGDQVTTSANGFTRSGYKFKWWNTAADGSGEDFYPGEKVTIASADVNLYAQWEQVAANQEFWTPIDEASKVTGKAISKTVGNMSITSGGATDAADINVDVTASACIVNRYNSSVDKHAKVLAIKANDKYIEIHFTDGSPINKLWLGATPANADSKNIVVVYSATSDFTTAGGAAHEFKKVGSTDNLVALPGNTQATKSFTDVSPSTENTYYYARIYRRITTANTVFDNTTNLGSGTTVRIYSIKAQKGVSCVAPATVNISGGYHFYPGETIELSAAPTGSPMGSPVSYQWKKDGVNVGTNSATFTKANATAADAGSYTCTISYGDCSTTSAGYQVKCMQILLKTNAGVDISTTALTKVDATHATVILNLTGGTTYNFRITDGCNNWYGNSDATGITSSNCTNWTMPHDADCKVTTGLKTANYTFNFDFSAGLLGSQMKVSVVYPGGNQAADKVIYWDNNVLNWADGSQWYRIGRSDHHNKTQLTKVYGTANLYKVTTSAYDNFEYWHIANNQGNGDGNLFWTKGDAAKAITNAMAFEGAPVTADAITITPGTDHSTGETSDNDNCQFYSYTITPGMKTQNVAISPYSNGTITVNYTNTSNVASTLTSGNADLAHSVILTSITAVPDAGYDASAITINGNAYTANYVVTGATTIAATFSPHVYSITYKDQGNVAFSGTHTDTPSAHPTSHTYNTATNLNGATKAGYTFGGWYTSPDCSTGLVTSLGATDYTANITLYAKWTVNTYDVDVTLTDSHATQESGSTGTGVATYGTNYVATFEAVSGYTLPDDVTVTIGGDAATKGTEYTWSVTAGVGTLTITGSYILGDISITVTAESAAAVQTALVINTLYEVPDMIPSGESLTSSDQFFDGLSANTKFELIGSGSGSTTPKVNNNSSNDKTIDGITFDDGSMWFKGNASLTSNIPTTYGLSFIVPEGGGKLYLYFSGTSTNIKLAKSGASGSKPSCPNGYGAVDVTAGTYYLYGTGTTAPYCFYGLKLCSTYSVSITPTNVTKETGATGAGAAIHGKAYTATFTAPVGYTLPSDVTSLTIGGVAQTKGTGYTWTISDGTATLTVPADKVTGNIVVSVAGVAAVTHDVTFSLTNVAYSSGDNQGTGAATEGVEFSTVFAASSGYSLPGTITVTIGGVEQTAGTGYTWAQGSGTLTIQAAYVTDDIVVTIVGEEMEGDGCDELVHTEAATATSLSTSVGTATLYNPSSQSKNSKAIKLNSTGYVELSPKAGKSFAAGDSLIVVVYNQATSAKTTGFKIGSTDYTASIAKQSNYTFRQKLVAANIVSNKVKIERNSSDGWFVSAIIKHCEDLPSCTTPTLPTLSNQTVCPGSDIAAWNAEPTNIATITGASEDVAYSWKKKGSDTEIEDDATLDLGSSATEGMAGTYVVTVTVSKTGYISKSASKEVTLTVTPATETPSVTASKATVYPGNSVTLTATCGSSGTITWAWYNCNSDGTGESAIGGATSNSYAIASAPAAGNHYYKVKATGDGTNACGTAEYVYTLTVSEASGTCNMMTIFDGSTMSSAPASTSGTESTSGATWTAVGTATEMSSTVSMEYSGKTYTKGWKFTGGATTSSSRYIQIVIPTGYTGDLVMNGFIGSTSRSVFVATSPTGTLNTSIAYWSPATTNTLATATTRLSAGTYYVCATNSAFLTELSVNVCGDEVCTDEKPTATATNNTVCSGTALTITATGYESDPTSIQWQKKNGESWDNISGATSATYSVASAAAADAGTYRVQVTKGCTRNSNEVTITVPSAPVFGTVPASVTVMQTIALSINTVEATDATKYKWYKSADDTWDAGDTEIGTNKELIKAYDGEAIGSPSYYIFCRAQNACGTTTSTAIAVNVTAYVEEDCATRGNEGSAEFSFENSGCGQGTYESTACWTMNSNSKILVYYPPTGKYFKTAKVTIASSSESKASYNWSTNGGTDYTAVSLTVNSTLTEHTINLSTHGNVNAFQIGRNFDSKGSSGGTLYVSKICFEYTDACTATTVTPSTASVNYEMGGAWSNPTFTLSVAGTLTYSSSNEDIASVDDDGTVTFNGEAGTVTITASYAGGTISATDYCASSGSYTINVSCPGGAPKVVADGSVDMSGCNSSVTLLAKTQSDGDFADGTYQWFRNGEEIDGATNSSYTATQAGTYTVERTNASDCTTPSTNSAIVTSTVTEPEVERLVPFQYYHVDKTYSDQMKMRHLFAVKNSGKLDGKSFKMYVSRNGDAATDVTSSNALVVWPNGDGHVDTVMVDLNKLSGKYSEDDELVFTCKAIDCEGNVSEVYKNTITMNVIGTTPTLALICSGSSKAGGTRKTGELTVGGDFLTGYNVADLCQQTGNTSFDANTEWGLYTNLKTQYIVTPVNGYAVFNKLNYEPFDILLLTDYPKASKSDAAATILDDMAALCDYRPMLSFKTHMVAKSPSKWAEKGFTTSPVVTKADGRLNLNIVCYAHPMFDGLKSGEDVYEDANNTSAPLVYTMLSGGGYESSKGMQGFELAAAENFVTIGLTHYNAIIAKDSPETGEASWTPDSEDRMLVTAAERQTNIEARFILFSINCGAQSKLTPKGEEVILACLDYLLKTDPLEVADCSFTFDNGASNEHDAAWYSEHCNTCTGTKGDGKWTTAANWGPHYRLLPGEFTSVRIKKPVEVNDEHAHVMEVRLIDEGSIDIPAGKALDVKSTIRRMDGSEIYPTDVNDIHIGSSASGNGTLIFNNNSGDTKARVDMYSNAQAADPNTENSATNSVWQYIGTPHTDVANARSNYYGSWLYQYVGGTWTVIPNGGPLVAFRGYCITNETAPIVYDMAGTLVATTTQDIAIPAGFTVIANSWVAPIDINAITDDDMEGITDKTIYFFNTGTDAEGTAGTGTAAGTYRATPIHSASYTGDWQIPSMQGFYVSTTSAGTFHLDYERHVRPAGGRTIVSNPMYAPRRAAMSDEPEVAKLFFRGHRYHDKLVVLEREDFTRGYDSGWDGEAWGGSDLSPMAYVSIDGRYDAVSAVPEYEGTVIGFRAGEDNECTIDFEYSEENEPLYLYDTETKQYTRVVTGNAYHFTTSDKAYHERFILTRNNPQTPTDIGNGEASGGARAKKFILNDKMYIMINGLLYDATGKVVK